MAALACGLLGPFVVIRRIGYVAGGIAHSLLWGLGVAVLWGQAPILGAALAALIGAAIIGWVNIRFKEQEDTIISALWSAGMAGGIILMSQAQGYQIDLMSYLFGNILMIGAPELRLMAGLDLVLLCLVGLFYKPLVAICLDEEFAKLRGVRTTAVYLLLLCLTALTVVVVSQVVGMVMLIAMLTLPAAIASHVTGRLALMMIYATLIGAACTVSGLALSYGPDWPSGATVILVIGVVYFASAFWPGWRNLLSRRNMPAVTKDSPP